MEKNLIIGLAFGYNIEQIQNFVLSFRRYSDDAVLIISDNDTSEFSDFLNQHNIYNMVYDQSALVMTARWELPKDALEEHFLDVENVILSDIRDVVFQDNPFNYLSGKDLDFSSEPETVGGCTQHNGLWVRNIYGDEVLDEIKDQQILCCGVTAGKRSAVIDLCNSLLEESKKVSQFIDQASLNVLYGRGLFPNSEVHLTGGPLVATMHHSKTLTFDRQGYLLGDNGKRIAMVHQYDRCGFSGLNFIKNALQVKGRHGVNLVANYASKYVPDHDLY
jgi:hypothetical protein